MKEAIEVLERRAVQGSLKGNSFEVFEAASEEEIKVFLEIIKQIDDTFDVEEYLDKTKTFHYSKKIKEFIDKNLIFTHYSITFKRFDDMSLEFLCKEYPEIEWKAPLEAVSCPVVDKMDAEKYVSYEELKKSDNKDFSDKCRPGKLLKVPSNIPFPKNKLRAFYGMSVEIVCFVCGKRRSVYIQHKPTKNEVTAAIEAVLDVKYVCGGRISSFGRSLSVLEEIAKISDKDGEVIEDQYLSDEVTSDEAPSSDENNDPAVSKRKVPSTRAAKLLRLESSTTSAGVSMFSVASDEREVDENGNIETNNKGPCSFCKKFETGHRCQACRCLCCNLCNRMEVDDLEDILCPKCETNQKAKKQKEGDDIEQIGDHEVVEVDTAKKVTGKNKKIVQVEKAKKLRGRPRKVLDAFESEEEKEVKDVVEKQLSEVRMLGEENILSKVFVDEAITCDSAIEAHIYDILLDTGKPLPCYYCGDTDEKNLFSKLTDENFPLCCSCDGLGRGAGLRRKSRTVKPKVMKAKKPSLKTPKSKKQKLID